MKWNESGIKRRKKGINELADNLLSFFKHIDSVTVFGDHVSYNIDIPINGELMKCEVTIENLSIHSDLYIGSLIPTKDCKFKVSWSYATYHDNVVIDCKNVKLDMHRLPDYVITSLFVNEEMLIDKFNDLNSEEAKNLQRLNNVKK